MIMTPDNAHSVWVIDDDQSIRWVLERALTKAEFVVTVFETASSALSRYKRIPAKERPQLILTDIRMPGISGFELLKQIKNVDSKQPVIIMTAYSDLDTTVQGYQQGAFEYLPKPFDIDEAIELVTKGCESHDRNLDGNDGMVPDNEIIGDSLPIKNLYRQMAKISTRSSNLLISGEHGTGKTLVANAIHFASIKKEVPLVAMNTSNSTTNNDISEIFTPLKQKSNATVLIKDIEILPKEAQGYLAQTLTQYRQNKQASTIRVIATTTTNLFDLAQDGTFDQPLYHLLNEVMLTLPPLRERRSDIPVLINHYLNRFGDELNEDAKPIEADAMTFLEQYEWPGNIRQLKNMCRSLSISSNMNIGLESLPPELFQTPQVELSLFSDRSINEWEYQLGIWAMRALAAGDQNIMSDAQSKLEKKLLQCALQTTRGRKHEAAKLLGWGRNTLTRKLKTLS
jgi:two-component system nitrogen regulation response regulator GlnG